MASSKILTLAVSGMSCDHCVMHVKEALSAMTGVQVEDVQIGSAKIRMDESMVSRDALAAVIEKAGYQLTSVE